jgi:hypothetical protein
VCWDIEFVCQSSYTSKDLEWAYILLMNFLATGCGDVIALVELKICFVADCEEHRSMLSVVVQLVSHGGKIEGVDYFCMRCKEGVVESLVRPVIYWIDCEV